MKSFAIRSIVHKSKRRIGNGYGSGRGKTAGRGTKGQNARGTMPLAFEGGQGQLIKRLPFLRGRGRNETLAVKAFPIAVDKLEVVPVGTTITLAVLKKHGIVEEGVTKVKILGGTKLTKKITVAVPCSKSATALIRAAGGDVTL